MKICVLAPDVPYPPNRGGRVDVLRRLRVFRELGNEVLLITSSTANQWSRDRDAVSYFSGLGITWEMVRPAGGKELIGNLVRGVGHRPIFVSKRYPDRANWARLKALVASFRPDVVWTEGPWLWELAREFSLDNNATLAYRSHNVEYQYMRRQADITPEVLKRWTMYASFFGLRGFECRAIRGSDVFFDISLEDLNFWGMDNGRWLPPLIDTHGYDVAAVLPKRSNEVLFVGNLRTPNNLKGIRWFASEVLPIVRKSISKVVFRVVGSSPLPEVGVELGRLGVSVETDVDNVFDWLMSSGVLVNPVMDGSGVQLKMLDMLMTDLPIVSTSQGVRGLPKACADGISVADRPEQFAAAVVAGLQGPPAMVDCRGDIRSLFTPDGIRDLLANVRS